MTEIERLQIERDKLAQQVETQAETIKRGWVENSRLRRRCEIQQRIIDKADAIIPPTLKQQAIAEAEALFKEADNGET